MPSSGAGCVVRAKRLRGPIPAPILGSERLLRSVKRGHESISWGAALGLLLAAALLHVLFAFAIQGVMELEWKGGSLPDGESVMEVSFLPEEAEAEPEEESLEQLSEAERERLVRQQAIANEKRPEDTDQISEFDQSVDKETVAPLQKPRPGRAGGNPSPQEKTSRFDGEGESDSTRGTSELGEREGEGASSAEDDISLDERGDVASKSGGAAPAPKGLRGTPDQLQGLFGRPGGYEDIPNVEQGDQSILNSRRNKYASFFNRIRDQVSQEWDPETIHTKNDPYGKIYGNKSRSTVLRILLNPDGSVHRIYVNRPSGVGYLDEEAIRAVRVAAPFVNPPAQLIDPKSGKIDFTFRFDLLFDGSKRIFRYKR